jgi:dihydrolipoamide dehydrogenase
LALRSIALRSFAALASNEYDLAIIGGGPGGKTLFIAIFIGYVAAIKGAQKGLKTVCIEKRGTLGGTCLNVGCIPSKALLYASHKFQESTHDLKELGIKVEDVKLDFKQFMKQKDQTVHGLTSGIEYLFKKNDVHYLKGWGRFSGKNEIEVDLLQGGKDKIKAKNIIIATGSTSNFLPGNTIKVD